MNRRIPWRRGWRQAAAVVAALALLPLTAAGAAAEPIAPSVAAAGGAVPAAWGQQPPGDGSSAVAAVPVNLALPEALAEDGIKAADLGRTGGCLVTWTGQVSCWGTGALGDGTNNASTVPVPVVTAAHLMPFTQVSVGDGFSCVLTAKGFPMCWGRNSFGQLGDGTTTDRLEPVGVQLPGPLAWATITSVSAGTDHACLTAFDPTDASRTTQIYCWGRNFEGQLGTGAVGGISTLPVRVTVPPAMSNWAVGSVQPGARHTCVSARVIGGGTTSGQIACWGDNSLGQLGPNAAGAARSAVPVVITFPGIANGVRPRDLTVGDNHACVLSDYNAGVGMNPDGRAFCWGNNSHGQLGNGTGGAGQFSATPVQVSPIYTYGYGGGRKLAAGQAHSCAVTISHAVACWGSEYWGTLGNGVVGTSLIQYPTLFANKPVAADMTGALAGVAIGFVAAGGSRSLALPDQPPSGPDVTGVRGGDGAAWVALEPQGTWDNAPAISTYEYIVTGSDGDGRWHPLTPPSTTSPLQIPGLTNGRQYMIGLRAVSSAAGPGTMAGLVVPRADVPSVFVPLATPARLVDTRTAGPGGSATPLWPDGRAEVATSGVVPPGATAVAYNLTVPNPPVSGHVRVMPGDMTRTPTSTVNFRAGETIANASVVRLDAQGEFAVHNGSNGMVNGVIDVVGYYLPTGGSLFTAVAPVRAYDSRTVPAGPLAGGADRVIDLAGQVPAGATAVAYNLTVPDTGGAGHLRVMPGDVASSPTSAINWSRAGDVIANGSVVGVDAQRRIRIFNGGGAPAHLVVDVVGYYLPEASGIGAKFHPMEPARSYDSRYVVVPPDSWGTPQPVSPAETRNRSVADALTPRGTLLMADAVPAGATAIAYNVTETQGVERGHFRVFPTGLPLPGTSTVNWPSAGYTRANGTMVQLPPDRSVSVYNGSTGSAHVIVDTVGYFQ